MRLPERSVVEFIRIEPVPVIAVEDAGVGDSAEDGDGINAIDAGHYGGLGAAPTETGTEATAHDESRNTTKGDQDDCRDNRDTAFRDSGIWRFRPSKGWGIRGLIGG